MHATTHASMVRLARIPVTASSPAKIPTAKVVVRSAGRRGCELFEVIEVEAATPYCTPGATPLKNEVSAEKQQVMTR